jgi:hypothetical protein
VIDSGRVRELLSRHGALRPQGPEDWEGEFPLPEPLEAFYREVGPVNVTIEGYGNPCFLPSLAALWRFQEGYRWNGIDKLRLPDWQEAWVVVGDEGGDPFILDRHSRRILVAQHGTGAWEPEELFEDVNEMAACLAAVGSVVAEAGLTLTDDGSDIRPEHRARAERLLAELLASSDEAAAVLAALGWG